MTLPSSRYTFLVIFLGCLGLTVTALFMQHFMGLKPCALCITQRVFVLAVGLTALMGFLVNPGARGRRIFSTLGIILAALGAAFSIRHVYIENLPKDQVPACGPGLNYLIENFPLRDALALLLRGDGNCAEVAWSLWGISLAGWTLVAFIGLITINLWQWIRR